MTGFAPTDGLLPVLEEECRMTNIRFSRMVMLAASAIMMFLTSLIYPTLANAVPPAAPINYYYYVQSYNSSTAYNWGCIQGQGDNTHGRSSLVSLDFGAQNSTNNGTIAPLSNTPLTYAQVEVTSEQYARGYFACSNSSTQVSLAITTNNSGPNVTSASGRSWGTEINRVASYVASNNIGQVFIEGGNDIESYGSWANLSTWISGYSATSTRSYLDIGSADGCPTGTTGGNGYTCGAGSGWTQYGYWYASWGAPDASVTPEIYNNVQENQWAWISEYGYSYHSSPITFAGPLDDHARDAGSPTPAQAWSYLWTAINSLTGTGMSTFQYASEQH